MSEQIKKKKKKKPLVKAETETGVATDTKALNKIGLYGPHVQNMHHFWAHALVLTVVS